MNDPGKDALASLGLRLGEPLRVDGAELVPATCRRCRASAWHWPGGWTSDGSAPLFDMEMDEGESFISLHDCAQGA